MAVTVDSLSIEIGYQANNASEGIDKLVESLRRLRSACRISALQKLADGINGLNAALNSVDPSSVQNVSDLSNAIQRMSGARMPRGGFNVNVNTNEVNAAADAVGDLNDTERDNAEATGDVAQEADRASGGLARMRSSFAALADRIKRSNGFLKTFWNAIKRIAFYRLIRSMIKAITDAFKEGIHNAYQFSKAIDYRLATAMDKVSSATMKMKNQLGSLGAEVISAVSPVLIRLAKIITWVADKMAQFIAAMQGYSTYLKATDVSKPWEEGADAVKKYKSNLQGFDELNVIEAPESKSDDDGGFGSMFEVADVSSKIAEFAEKIKGIITWVKDHLDELLPIVLAIGAALLAWKLSSLLGVQFGKIFGILLTIVGVFLEIKGAADAWVNGVNWSNFQQMLIGTLMITAGLSIAFGAVAGAVGLLVGGIVMLVVGIHDWIATGELTTETLALIEAGIIAVGVALALLTGSWIPLVIAAVVGIVLVIYKYWDEIKAFFAKVWQAIKTFFSNIPTYASAIWAKIVTGAKKLGSDIKKVFQTIVSSIQTILAKIKQFFTTKVINPITTALTNFKNTVVGIFNTIVNTVGSFINNAFSTVINGILKSIEDVINFFINGINGAIDIINKIPGVQITLLDPISLPRLASGGIAYSETTAIIGEQGKEAVLPLENNTQWMDILADKVSQNINVSFTIKEDPRGLFEVTQEEAAKFVRRTNRPPYPSPSRA